MYYIEIYTKRERCCNLPFSVYKFCENLIRRSSINNALFSILCKGINKLQISIMFFKKLMVCRFKKISFHCIFPKFFLIGSGDWRNKIKSPKVAQMHFGALFLILSSACRRASCRCLRRRASLYSYRHWSECRWWCSCCGAWSSFQEFSQRWCRLPCRQRRWGR